MIDQNRLKSHKEIMNCRKCSFLENFEGFGLYVTLLPAKFPYCCFSIIFRTFNFKKYLFCKYLLVATSIVC